MPRLRAILLEVRGGNLDFVMWADVPAGRERFYAGPMESAWHNALPADNAELQAGRVVERVRRLALNNPPLTRAQIKTEIQKLWTRFQDEITNGDDFRVYGTAWDGASWIDGGM